MKNIGVCKNCKWWSTDEDFGPRLGWCLHDEVFEKVFRIPNPIILIFLTEPVTRNDFGCIYWERRHA